MKAPRYAGGSMLPSGHVWTVCPVCCLPVGTTRPINRGKDQTDAEIVLNGDGSIWFHFSSSCWPHARCGKRLNRDQRIAAWETARCHWDTTAELLGRYVKQGVHAIRSVNGDRRSVWVAPDCSCRDYGPHACLIHRPDRPDLDRAATA